MLACGPNTHFLIERDTGKTRLLCFSFQRTTPWPNCIELLSTSICLAWHFTLIKTGLPTKFLRDFRDKQTTAEYQLNATNLNLVGHPFYIKRIYVILSKFVFLAAPWNWAQMKSVISSWKTWMWWRNWCVLRGAWMAEVLDCFCSDHSATVSDFSLEVARSTTASN